MPRPDAPRSAIPRPDAPRPAIPRPDAPRYHVLRLNELDNVGVAASGVVRADSFSIGSQTVVAIDHIPPGHKVCLRPIGCGQAVLKYGQPIGVATRAIGVGEHVHSHNLADEHVIDSEELVVDPPPSPPKLQRTFQGYVRDSGRVATRNYVAIVSSVNCSASVSKMIASRFDAELMKRYPHVDGVIALTHEGGCAMAYDGLKHQMLSRTIAGMVRHPNVAACLMIGLGCEQNTFGYMASKHRIVPLMSPAGEALTFSAETLSTGTPTLSMQDEGGTRRTVERGVALVSELLRIADRNERVTVDASHLIVGLECGGSDGFSGITANPAVGVAADRIVACGGAAVLSETTEICGAEHLLVRRSRSPEVARKLIQRIEWWKAHTAMFGQKLDNNPSVGNKAGGLTTITEKSLGAVSKSGTTALEAVYDYAFPITAKGLSVMDTPGFDPASVTGKVAGGANVILFTTGRGSCFGFKPTPCLKIASNNDLFRRLDEDMDLNAGGIVDGVSVETVGEEIFEAVLRVASGEQTKSELLGIGDNEFVPWTVGPTL